MKSNPKNDNRKALPKYLLIMLLSGLIGGVLGTLTFLAGTVGLADRALGALDSLMRLAACWGLPVTSLLTLTAAAVLYRRAKALCAAWDGEDESTVDRAEQKLNWVLLLTALQMALSLFFFSAAVIYVTVFSLWLLVETALFLASVAVIVVLQQKVVDLTRKLNPEKQGSIYDLKFKKKWLASCDEAEQQQIGQAAYQSYRVVNAVCPILWGILIFLSFIMELSLLPSFLVLLIWGLLNLTYIAECIRMKRTSLP